MTSTGRRLLILREISVMQDDDGSYYDITAFVYIGGHAFTLDEIWSGVDAAERAGVSLGEIGRAAHPQLAGGCHRFSARQHRCLARAGRRGIAVIDLRSLQRALGGEISGGQLLCPGPGHSPRDRSLAVRPSPDGDGFVVHSHCGDDWTLCKDYVRERLGLPQWQPGDGRDRRVDPSRLKTFERAAVEAEAERRPLTQDDRVRIERARAVWDEATDPRGTLAERYLAIARAGLDDDVAGKVLRYHPRCPWRDENTGATVGVPALVAVFRSRSTTTQ